MKDMAGFTESGIALDFPSDSWFRFQQSKPYSDVSGFGFKEMDACYLFQGTNRRKNERPNRTFNIYL